MASNQELTNLSCQCMPNQFGCKPKRSNYIYQNFGRTAAINKTTRPYRNFGHATLFGHAKKMAGLIGAQTKHTRDPVLPPRSSLFVLHKEHVFK
jgi:hypothetical protein